MDRHRPLAQPNRALRWCLAGAVCAALLAGYWLALDRLATRIGLDAENTLRALPASDTGQRPEA